MLPLSPRLRAFALAFALVLNVPLADVPWSYSLISFCSNIFFSERASLTILPIKAPTRYSYPLTCCFPV